MPSTRVWSPGDVCVASVIESFRVRIESNAFATLRTTDIGVNRELGVDPDAPTLPTPAGEVDTWSTPVRDSALEPGFSWLP
jgi:hypothetical protein